MNRKKIYIAPVAEIIQTEELLQDFQDGGSKGIPHFGAKNMDWEDEPDDATPVGESAENASNAFCLPTQSKKMWSD